MDVNNVHQASVQGNDKVDNGRRRFIKSAGLAAVAFAIDGGAQSIKDSRVVDPVKSKNDGALPNIIVVFTDQLRSFSLGCYGDKTVRTPNIDQLASTGVRFEHAVANCPGCVPSRSTLLSGQHARTCVGSRLNEIGSTFGRNDRRKFRLPTLAEQLKKKGYRTAEVGKWHVDTKPSLLGFDESLIIEYIFTKGNAYRNEGKSFQVDGFTADFEIEEVKNYIRDNKNNPFFLYYNMVSPHMPLLDVPYQYSRMYDPANMPLRPNVWKEGRQAFDEKWFHIYMWSHLYNPPFKPVTAKVPEYFTLNHLTALYYGSVTWVDDLLGEMVRSLKENGIYENTIIVFCSDHGDLLGSHHLWDKARLYEEAIRVPMIYSWPGRLKPGANNTRVTSIIDIMPTLLDLCGGEVPDGIQGASVASLLNGQNDSIEDNCAFVETAYGDIGIRTQTHMYGAKLSLDDKRVENEEWMFFDLIQDPYQQHNLAKTDTQAAIKDVLKKRLMQWNHDTPRLPNDVSYTAFCQEY